MWPRPKTSILRPVDPTTPPLPPWAQVKGHWPTLVARRVPAKKTKICREPILPLICRDLASPASRKWIPVLLWELKMESRCKYFFKKLFFVLWFVPKLCELSFWWKICKYCVQKKWSVPIRQQSSSQVRQLLYNRLTAATQFVTAFQFTSTA